MVVWDDFSKTPYLLDNFFRQYDDEQIFMQFTGLHDKNGKEIWEGDILGYENEKNIVRWSNIQAKFLLDWIKNEGRVEGMYGFNEALAMDYEVLGNIYENPELLK